LSPPKNSCPLLFGPEPPGSVVYLFFFLPIHIFGIGLPCISVLSAEESGQPAGRHFTFAIVSTICTPRLGRPIAK